MSIKSALGALHGALKQLVPSYGYVAIGTAILVIYYSTTFRHNFVDTGQQSISGIQSSEFRSALLLCLGGSIALWVNTVSDFVGKYLIKECIDLKFSKEFAFILSILLPSVCLYMKWDDINALSFFWLLFHMQIMTIINVGVVFWAEKMGLSVRCREVQINSILNVATFTMHVFATRPSWSATSRDGCNVVYMFLFAAHLAYLAYCVRLTRNKNTNKNSVVLIDTAAAEQQWALCVISCILVYYVVFLVLEAGVYPGNDRFNLQGNYLSAQYVLLSVTALALLTLHQRKDMYHGVMSQASLEIKRLFVRNVSHEIRTPLNTTLLGLNLLETEVKEGVLDPAVLADLIGDATGSCSIAINILNDLLNYEKIDGGLLTLERAEMPVWGFVEGVLKVFLIQAKSLNVELAWPQRCVKGVYAEIDEYKLSQVLRNLVSNALKFTPKGGRVRVTAEVLVPGCKPRTARSLSVLKEMDESAAEEYEEIGGSVTGSAAKGETRSENKRISRAKRTKPTAKAAEFDDIAGSGPGVNRSHSVASEETPPHIYSYPPDSPAHRYSARGVLLPEASSTTFATTAGVGRNAASAAPSIDFTALSHNTTSEEMLEAGALTTSSATAAAVNAPALDGSVPPAPDAAAAPGLAAGGVAETPAPAPRPDADAKNTEARSSPESSNGSTPPDQKQGGSLSSRTMQYAKKFLSADQERSNLQIFPSTNMVRISVTDSGAGISKENQDRLFKEIVQFNANKLQNGGGSGIGLWISSTIVKLHGGKIGVMSDGEGQGSTFYIDIPISKIERGSNYKHVSPAHLDVSSKHKYNSPAMSPVRGVQIGGSGHSSPAHVMHSPGPVKMQPFDPNRAFISPESERSSYRATLATVGEAEDRAPPQLGAPLAQINLPSASGRGVQTALQAPLFPHPAASGAYASALHAAAGEGMPRQMSDQSIFTGGGSNRSNRSRGTNQSSFSTDTDGISSKTEGVDASSGAGRSVRGALPAHIEAAIESVQQDEDRLTTYTVYRPNDPAVNLFPDPSHSGEHSSRGQSSQSSSQPSVPPLAPQQRSVYVDDTGTAAVAPSAISAEAQRLKRLYDKRALIVDDSPTNRKFVNRLLRTKISTRDEAEDGKMAVEMVAASMAAGTPYDVILMDYVMPVMDGPTATELIRRNGYKGVILGVTGNGHQAEIDLFRNAGADKILVKPLSADQFTATLLEMLT